MLSYFQDARYALRLFMRYRAFTLLAIATLALGIGVTTAIFTVINAVLWRPLPYADSERLVLIRGHLQGRSAPAPLSSGEVVDLRGLTHVLSSVAALAIVNGDLTTRENDLPMERVAAASATDNIFATLGVAMAMGRPLHEGSDTGTSAIRAVVLSHELWTRRYQADPGLVGRTIEVNNLTVTVAGILPRGFRIIASDDTGVPDRIDIWFPASLDRDRQSRGYITIGRLAPGVTLDQAGAELATLAARASSAYRDAYLSTPLILTAATMQEDAARTVKPALGALGGAVMFVLLIACANVANLLLARTTARARELAVRSALGASRGRMLRQLLMEGLMLGLAGGGLGVLTAQWAEGIVQWSRPPTLPATEIQIDGSVLLFACAVTLVVTLLFSIAPALQGLRQNALEVLRNGGRTAAADGHRLRSTLVIVEVALGVILLTGAGLMMRSVAALTTVEKGFDERDVLTLRLSMRPREFAEFEKKWQFYRQALEQVAAIPGVRSVGAVRPLPLEGTTFTDRVEVAESGGPVTVSSHTTLPGYFGAMGIRLLQGRDFEARDIASQRDVMLVDEGFARQAWPGADPIGKRLSVQRSSRPALPFEVIGVVGHVRAAGLRDPGAPQIYLPYHRNAIFDLALTMKASGDPGRIAAAVRDRIERLGGKRPVYMVRPMSEYIADAAAETRFVSILLGAFATLALGLSLVGLYGVVAYTTEQRTREIAVRIALGASPQDIMRLVMGMGMVWTACGILLGTLSALALAGWLRSLLFAVSPADPITMAGVAFLLSLVTIIASYLPARRALRVAAWEALRSD